MEQTNSPSPLDIRPSCDNTRTSEDEDCLTLRLESEKETFLGDDHENTNLNLQNDDSSKCEIPSSEKEECPVSNPQKDSSKAPDDVLSATISNQESENLQNEEDENSKLDSQERSCTNSVSSKDDKNIVDKKATETSKLGNSIGDEDIPNENAREGVVHIKEGIKSQSVDPDTSISQTLPDLNLIDGSKRKLDKVEMQLNESEFEGLSKERIDESHLSLEERIIESESSKSKEISSEALRDQTIDPTKHDDKSPHRNKDHTKLSEQSTTLIAQDTKKTVDKEKNDSENNVEQNLLSLFSESDVINESEKSSEKVDSNESDETNNQISSAPCPKTGSDIDDVNTKNISDSEKETPSQHKNGENNNEIISEESVAQKKLLGDRKLRELHSLLDDNESNPDKDLDFSSGRIEIKEEIESFDGSPNSFEGFEETFDESSYGKNGDVKNCFVVLERCDDSLCQTDVGEQAESAMMKIVAVESLSDSQKQKRQKTENYEVWTYFKKIDSVSAECKICGRCITHTKIYNLTRHLRSVHHHYSFVKKKPIRTNSLTSKTAKKSQSHLRASIASRRAPTVRTGKVALSQKNKDPAKTSSKSGDITYAFSQQPLKFFSLVNSQTAKCKLCAQYMPYRSNDDLSILKSHLHDSHLKKALDEKNDANFDISIKKKSAKIWKYFKQLTSRTCVCKICSQTFHFNNDYFSKLICHLYLKHSVHFERIFFSLKDFAEALVNDKLRVDSKTLDKEANRVLSHSTRRDGSSEKEEEEEEEEEEEGEKDEDKSTEEPTSDNANETKPRQRTWTHFTKLERGLAQCNACQKCFSYGGGNLDCLTRHLKNGHKVEKTTRQRNPIKNMTQEKGFNSKSKKKNNIRKAKPPIESSMTEKELMKYFSFLKSDKALCKKCFTKVSFTKGDNQRLMSHFQRCSRFWTSERDSKNKRPALKRPVISDSDDSLVSGDENIKDPDFVVPNFDDEEDSDIDKHKTKLMAAVELSPKEKSLQNSDDVWTKFKKLNGVIAQCLHCLKKLSYKKGDTWLLEQHLELWHNSTATANKSTGQAETSLEDIPLLFRLKNQSESYSLSDCYYRKKLQYNEIEIRSYFRKLFNNKLVCKLCSSQFQVKENVLEVLITHILQEHVRKLFKPKPSQMVASNDATPINAKNQQTPVSAYKNRNVPLQAKRMQMVSPGSVVPPSAMRRYQARAQSTPLPLRDRARTTTSTNSDMFSSLYNKGYFPITKFDLTWRYFIELGRHSRYKCKVCNKVFVGGRVVNLGLLSKHILFFHLKNVIDDETELKPDGSEQRKAIVESTRQRLVNKFSEINEDKITCKICSNDLQNDGFDTMKAHALNNHKDYVRMILKDVMRVQNYNCTNMRKFKRLLTLQKKRYLKAKCTLCSCVLGYNAGNTKRLFAHLLKFHKKALGKKISTSKAVVWKYFSKQRSTKSKCEICLKFISSKIHCNHKIPQLFSLTTGLELKSRHNPTTETTSSSKPVSKKMNKNKTSYFYFSALKQFNPECIFCAKPSKNDNKLICKIACRFSHGNEFMNWIWKDNKIDETAVPDSSAVGVDASTEKTLSVTEMIEQFKKEKINSIRMCYLEFSNKYHCNLCSENLSRKHLNIGLYFDHAFEKHKGMMSMHRALLRKPMSMLDNSSQSQSGIDAMKSSEDSSLARKPKNTKLVKVKLWHHFTVAGTDLAICNFCNTKFRYTSTNVDNLSNHLRAAHLTALLNLNDVARKPSTQSLMDSAKSPRKSNTWNYFSVSNKVAQCKLCDKKFLNNDGLKVAPLTRHLQTVHKFATSVPEDQSPAKASLTAGSENEASEENRNWVWQYFVEDDKRIGTAQCKQCSIYVSSEEGKDLLSALHQHLRLVHNMWVVKVGKCSKQSDQGTKRQAISPGEDVLSAKATKRVKFNDTVEENSAIEEMDTSSLTSPLVQEAGTNLARSENEKNCTNQEAKVTAITGNKDASKNFISIKKDFVQRIQDVEKDKNKKSLVWTYFTKIDGQPDFSKCNICSKSISSKFGNSILRTHLRVKHNILIVSMNQYPHLKKSANTTNGTVSISSTIKDTEFSPAKAKQNIQKMLNSPMINTPNPKEVNSPTFVQNSVKLEKNHPVWSYFTSDNKNAGLSKCNLCSVYLSCRSGRSDGLQNHLRFKHNIVFVDADPLIQANRISQVEQSSKNLTPEKLNESGRENVLSTQTSSKESPTTDNGTHQMNNEVDNTLHSVLYANVDNSMTIYDGGDTAAGEAVHYEVVETTHRAEEPADIVKVISDLLPNYSTGISDDVHATEISPQESELISNIVTTLSDPNTSITVKEDINQLKSIAVLSGETEDTSLTWDFYVKLGDNKAKCDVCSEVLTYEDKNADNLTDHIQSKHSTELAQYKLSRLDFSDSCIIVVKDAK